MRDGERTRQIKERERERETSNIIITGINIDCRSITHAYYRHLSDYVTCPEKN